MQIMVLLMRDVRCADFSVLLQAGRRSASWTRTLSSGRRSWRRVNSRTSLLRWIREIRGDRADGCAGLRATRWHVSRLLYVACSKDLRAKLYRVSVGGRGESHYIPALALMVSYGEGR